MKRNLLLAVSAVSLAVLLDPMSVAQASELGGIIKNNEGVRRFKGSRNQEAYEHFNGAMADLPFAPEVHYNLGNSFMQNKELEKALSEFLKAAELSKGQEPKASTSAKKLRFLSLFNAAVASTELKKIDEALGLYQQALEVEPDSLETKTNIELLTQQGGEGGGEGEQKDQQQDKGDQKDKNKQGEGQDQKDQKDPKDPNKDQQNQQNPQQQQQSPKPQPRPFKSEEISQKDVGRILEELKRQEEQIRAKMQGEGAKDVPAEKDW